MFGTGGQTLARSRRREPPKDGFHWRGPICFSVAGVAEYGKNAKSSGGRHNILDAYLPGLASEDY